MRVAILAALFCSIVPASVHAQATTDTPDDQVPISFIMSANPHTMRMHQAADGGGVIGSRSNGSVLGVDSVANWSSYFYFPGFDSFGNTQFTWEYTMVGHTPFAQGNADDWQGETTRIEAPIVPVNLDLRNFDGTPRFLGGKRMFLDATQYVTPVLNSPVFSKTFYSSSEDPTQFTDAIMRAEFFHKSDDEWHTVLKPRVATPRTMVLIRGTYRFAPKADGTCCLYVLVDDQVFGAELFPATATDTTTVIGAAENAGEVLTKDISTFLFPNTFLYLNHNPKDCCVIGYHAYDVEPGGPDNGFRERRYVMNYSSWVSPGLFGSSFADITALSHEMSELFNDPFVNNATPWWLAPNGNCQNNLETGDVIEGLPNAEFPMVLNGATYHPQNEALLQWFAGVTSSSAINHVYSYPDGAVLPTPSTSQAPGCPAP